MASSLSVIMSVYNIGNKNVLADSVNSILNQSFNNLEFIICNDGSTDGTKEYLDDLCNNDKRVKIITNSANKRAAIARNQCINECTGDYIAIMDADDISAPDRLRHQLDYLEANRDIDFVGTSAHLFDEKGVWGKRNYKKFPCKKDFLFVLPFVHASVMFRASTLRAVEGYRSAKETNRTEDYDLFLRLYAHGYKGANLDEYLYYVREDQGLYNRRKYEHKINEVIVRYKGFKALNLLPRGYPFVVKPLVVGLIPHKLLTVLKDYYYQRKKVGGQ